MVFSRQRIEAPLHGLLPPTTHDAAPHKKHGRRTSQLVALDPHHTRPIACCPSFSCFLSEGAARATSTTTTTDETDLSPPPPPQTRRRNQKTMSGLTPKHVEDAARVLRGLVLVLSQAAASR